MSEKMAERVACAIFDADYPQPFDYRWHEASVEAREPYLKRARAAIEAMADPTEAMMVAAEEAVPVLMSFAAKEQSPSYLAHRAMVEAALKP